MASGQEGDETIPVLEVSVEKEGYFELLKKGKWKRYYFLLSGGCLYYKSKEKHVEMKGIIKFKDGKVTKPKVTGKKELTFELKVGDVCHTFAFESDTVLAEWRKLIKANVGKEPGDVGKEVKKKQSTFMAFKKNIVGSAATSSAGKSYIREMSGEEGVQVIKLVKKLISLQDGKKKAKEFEDGTFRLGVKVVLLYRNKDLSYEELASNSQVIKALWSDILDFLELPFCLDKDRIKKVITELEESFIKMLRPYISEKNVTLIKDNLQYLRSDAILDKLYLANDTSDIREDMVKTLRTLWDRIYGEA